MLAHGGSSAGSYLADHTSPIPSHCAGHRYPVSKCRSASIAVTGTVRVKWGWGVVVTVFVFVVLLRISHSNILKCVQIYFYLLAPLNIFGDSCVQQPIMSSKLTTIIRVVLDFIHVS